MQKERLYILVYLDSNKLLIRNLKDIKNYEFEEQDLFIYIRDELFFGENGILELADYFNIPNLEDVMDEQLKKVFYTPYIINGNYEEFIKTTQDTDLYREIVDLYSFFTDNSKIITLEEFKESYNNEES